MTVLPSVSIASPKRLGAGPVVVGCFEGRRPETGELPASASRAALAGAGRGGFRGRARQIARAAFGPGGARLVAVHGLGAVADFGAPELDAWLARVAAEAGREGLRDLLLVLPSHPATAGGNALRILRLLLLSGYRYERFRGEPRPQGPARIRVLPPAGEAPVYRRALRLARPLAEAIRTARDLGNTPPNEASPDWLAGEARRLGRARSMEVTVLGEKELARRGMGGLLAVGGGSANPPRMVRLDWGDGGDRVAFVGKGVTFDTGGISIKPARAMDEMKYDKCGACAVLAVACAVADLDLPVRLSAYLPLAENMPDGSSYRPGDIIRCYGGKTVEVLNTDAEGRLILADALSWAAEEEPDLMVELSTLTGASVVALGHAAAALYTPDDGLAEELSAAGEASGERLWRMPLWGGFAREMEGHHADLRNVAGRWGGANHAAAFLAAFTRGIDRWAHLDIAGTAWIPAETGRDDRGATGFGVALAVDWLLRRAERI